MKRIKEAFGNMNRLEKVAFIVGLISSVLVIFCAILQLIGVWDDTIVICEICMGIAMITQAILQWKKNRSVAIFSLGVAIFIFAVAIFILFIG